MSSDPDRSRVDRAMGPAPAFGRALPDPAGAGKPAPARPGLRQRWRRFWSELRGSGPQAAQTYRRGTSAKPAPRQKP